MKIGLIVDPYGEKSPGGLGRAIFEMARALVESDHQNTYTLYFKKEPDHLPNIAGNHWHTEELGGASLLLGGARKIDHALDLYIFFTPIIPLFFFPKKSIVVAHDFAYLELPNQSFKQRCTSFVLFVAQRMSLWKATKIIAVSHATKESVVKHFRIAPEKVHVVYNGFIANSGVSQEIGTPPRFFLFAGVLKERKNVAGVIRAFTLFSRTNDDYHLLIAGKKEGAYADFLQQLVRELGVEKRVCFLGYVTDGQLDHLYRTAQALVFPSFIEGFGMPILEAMHAGLPVITSSTGALAEVAGDAALLVNPTSPEDIAAAMCSIATDLAVRQGLREKGLQRSKQFSWQKATREFLEILTQVAHTGPKS